MRCLFGFVVVVMVLGLGCNPPAECAADADCPDGQACAISEGRLQCVETCNADAPCPAGFACVVDGDRAVCLGIVGDLEDRRECTADIQCASGACVGEEDGVQACTATCVADGDCPEGERCYAFGPRKICAEPLDERATGEACDTPRQCASTRCVVLPHIDPDEGQCAEACGVDGDCGEGEGCAPLLLGGQVCVVLGEDGEACSTSDTCTGEVCVIDGLQDDDQICASACVDDDCGEGFACVVDSTDRALCLPVLEAGAAGEACDSARDCASGHCGDFSSGGDFGARCADACLADDTCADENLVCYETDFGPNLCGPIPEA